MVWSSESGLCVSFCFALFQKQEFVDKKLTKF